ncbi:MAG: hypothetical protein Q7S92_04910 [Candidatus Diapherotrites archaeon]|nr:hypothetical protein [Candidatus Diapherotrites archaeon]
MHPVKPKPARRVRLPRKVLRPKPVALTPELRSSVLAGLEQAVDLHGLLQRTRLPSNVVRVVIAEQISSLTAEKQKLNDALGKVSLGSVELHGIIRKMGDLNSRLMHLERLLDSQ